MACDYCGSDFEMGKRIISHDGYYYCDTWCFVDSMSVEFITVDAEFLEAEDE